VPVSRLVAGTQQQPALTGSHLLMFPRHQARRRRRRTGPPLLRAGTTPVPRSSPRRPASPVAPLLGSRCRRASTVALEGVANPLVRRGNHRLDPGDPDVAEATAPTETTGVIKAIVPEPPWWLGSPRAAGAIAFSRSRSRRCRIGDAHCLRSRVDSPFATKLPSFRGGTSERPPHICVAADVRRLPPGATTLLPDQRSCPLPDHALWHPCLLTAR